MSIFKAGYKYPTFSGQKAFVATLYPNDVMVGHVGNGNIGTSIVCWDKTGRALWTNKPTSGLEELRLLNILRLV